MDNKDDAMKFWLTATVFCALTLALIWGVIGRRVDIAVERVIVRDAIAKAEEWSDYVITRMPDLPGLVDTGVPTIVQQEVIREVRMLGGVFRFKLFDAQGRLTLISDERSIVSPQVLAAIPDPEPKQVIETGEPIIEV